MYIQRHIISLWYKLFSLINMGDISTNTNSKHSVAKQFPLSILDSYYYL